MFVCPQCGASFKNFHEKTKHSKHCSSIMHRRPAITDPFNAVNTIPSLSDLPPLTSQFQHSPSHDAMDTGFEPSHSTVEHTLPLVNVDSAPVDIHPDAMNWRGVPSSIPQTPLTPTAMLDHELQIARDVRKHESKQASLWTNKNYRILSQLINSLSLSQSDADRLLNAVVCHLNVIASFQRLTFIADSRH